MAERSAPLVSARDAFLVVGMAMAAFVLGTIAAGYEDHGVQPALVAAAHRGIATDAIVEPAGQPAPPVLRFSGPAAPDSAVPVVDRPRLAPEAIAAPSAFVERFFGEGAGRRDHTAASDPHDGRSYILTTASLMHRRGWIGLEDRVAETASGSVENPVRPAAHGGPR